MLSEKDIRITVTEARDFFAEYANRTRYLGERYILTRHGRDVAALVPLEDLKRLEEMDSC